MSPDSESGSGLPLRSTRKLPAGPFVLALLPATPAAIGASLQAGLLATLVRPLKEP